MGEKYHFTTFKEIEKNSIPQWENLQSHVIVTMFKSFWSEYYFFPSHSFTCLVKTLPLHYLRILLGDSSK